MEKDTLGMMSFDTRTDFGQIDSKHYPMPISLLQLGKTERTFLNAGFSTVGDLVEWASNGFSPPVRGIGAGKIKRVIQSITLITNGAHSNIEVKGSSKELMPLDDPIGVLHLGPHESILIASGYTTIGDLVEWENNGFTPRVRGLGTKKVRSISSALHKLSIGNLSTPATLRSLNPLVSSIPSAYFHLGPRAAALQKAGYETLRDLAHWYENGCATLPAFGKKSVFHAKRMLESLNDTLGQDGIPDWDKFCKNAGITLLPKTPYIQGEQSILKIIPDVIEGIIESAADEIEADILRNRLTQVSGKQLTLEELGQKHGVTRERIRQKQKKLLIEISNGLMDGRYEKSEYRFRSEFAAVWHKAEQAFEGRGELDASTFLSQLGSAWGVKIGDLLEHLPFIFAVLTSTHSIPNNFRVYLQYPILTSKGLNDELLGKSTKQLRLGKKVEFLHELNIATVGELLEMFRAFPDEFSGSEFHELFYSLETFLQSLDAPSDFYWDAYYHYAGLTLLPSAALSSPKDFLDALKPTLVMALELGEDDYYKFSREVLMYRSFSSRDNRSTAQHLADLVGTTAANIYRVERELNSRLRSVLVERNFSRVSVIFTDDFLDFWSQIEAAYKEGESVEEYQRKLVQAWGLSHEEIRDYIDLFWSILTNHPPGRNRNWYKGVKRPRKKPKLSLEHASAPVIVLRKARRVH